jgi:hypothetical protein
VKNIGDDDNLNRLHTDFLENSRDFIDYEVAISIVNKEPIPNFLSG